MEPIYIAAGIYFAIGGLFLFLGLWSRDPRHLGYSIGRLVDSKKVMRLPYRHSTRKVPCTTSTYLYEAGGKTYRLRYDGRFGRSRLLPRVTVVYLKGFPRFGHLETYPWGLHTILGVFFLICSVCILLTPYL